MDIDAFMRARLTPRTQDVPVPALAEWFPAGCPAVWRVRSVDANALLRSEEAKTNRARRSALFEALTAGSSSEIVGEARAVLGLDRDAVEPTTAAAIELVVAGSVDPPCSEDLAVRLAEHYPVVLFALVAAIKELSGQGSDVEKKPGSSGPTLASEPPSPSATANTGCSTSSDPTAWPPAS